MTNTQAATITAKTRATEYRNSAGDLVRGMKITGYLVRTADGRIFDAGTKREAQAIVASLGA